MERPPEVGRGSAADDLDQGIAFRGTHAVNRPEAREQPPGTRGSDPRDRHQLCGQPAGAAPASVARDRETVRLVAHPLEQQAHRVVGLEKKRAAAVREGVRLMALREKNAAPASRGINRRRSQTGTRLLRVDMKNSALSPIYDIEARFVPWGGKC